MSSEPPGSGDAQEGPAPESSRSDVDRPSSDGGRARWKAPIATAVAVLAIAGGVGVFLFVNHGSDSKPEHVTPAFGLTCPTLKQAADAYDREDRAAYNQAIDQAAHVAEDTLQKSGEVFGEPERIALELNLGAHERIPELLRQAEKVCSRLGQWIAASN
jgi:hypothetical protein